MSFDGRRAGGAWAGYARREAAAIENAKEGGAAMGRPPGRAWKTRRRAQGAGGGAGYSGLAGSALGVRQGRNRNGIGGGGRRVLGAPLGGGAAPVVQLGAVGIDQRAERAEEFREIAGEAGCFAGLTGHDTLLRPLSAARRLNRLTFSSPRLAAWFSTQSVRIH